MPSSTSSSDMPANKAEVVFERPLPALGRTGWLAVIIAIILVVVWETWVRSEGVSPSYRNSDGLWAEQRRKINHGHGDGWVFTGSSRTLFNLQLPVWERLDGRPPLQLALEGSTPVPVMEQLADDPDFTGKLIVGVAPGLFFSGYNYRSAAIDRYHNETPTQWLGHKISILVEPFFAFYNFDFALPTVIRRQAMPERDGVEHYLDVRKLSDLDRVRNTRMWDRLEYDEDYRTLARNIWGQDWQPLAELPDPVREKILKSRETQLEKAIAATKKLQAKGVEVIFIQMPYNGHYARAEVDIAPRELTWDKLIEQTGALGLHFKDHEEMQGYWLPEWSHMTGSEADRFTEAFYGLVQYELSTHRVSGGNR